ncbi:hypothetical protein H6P81_001544 [Aristolochia fimbriata]|uniref:fructokinase n=1 Tax=Aristolochia fimbriata TaxID=158543 RepID=A0AAV7FB28_ARIFI|nr:hypothetical protein H6P81_001544 [Aristolochia fimbriata]
METGVDMEYLFVLVQRILSVSAVILFFRWLVRHFLNMANMAKQQFSSDIDSSETMSSETRSSSSSSSSMSTTRCRRKRRKETLVVCFGEMLVDFVPNVPGECLAEASGFVKAPGGAPANVAVAVTKLGGRSAFIGKFGDDEFGRMLVDVLRRNGVNRDGVRYDPDPRSRTALAFVSLKKDGLREFVFYRNPSADMMLQDSELDLDLIRRGRIFHFGSISLIAEPCRGAHIAAMKAAKEAGLLLSYDPNVRLPLWPSTDEARAGILSVWNQSDVIKVSDDEVAFLTNGGDPYKDEVTMSLWSDELKLLVVTDGEKGCRYFTKGFRGKVNGFAVETVDTTGAGDAFVGALLFSLAEDDSILQDEEKLRSVLRFCNACGALSTTQKGAIPALPNTSMALELIEKFKE